MDVTFSDVCQLDAGYLAHQFDPESNGISATEIAYALETTPDDIRSAFLQKVRSDLRERIQAAKPSHEPDTLDILAARRRIIDVYLWEVIYRKTPAVYHRFSLSQHFPFDRIYPPHLIDGRSVVDVGCGSGRLTWYIARHAGRVYGVDRVAELLRIARRVRLSQSHVCFVQGDLRRLPFADRSVDLVVSSMAFQLTCERGGAQGLREMRRITKPGGEIRVIVGAADCMEFLTAAGFVERFVPGPLMWTSRFEGTDDDARALLKRMYSQAQQIQASTDCEPDYLFRPARWKPRRTLANIIAWTQMRASFRSLFFRASIFHPIGTPYFSLRV